MPLRDHFRPPLSVERHWESFHGRWAAAIADSLNEDLLPPGYFAEFQVHVGSSVEVDVAAFERSGTDGGSREGGTATLSRVWAPPAPAMLMPIIFPDNLEVLVFASEAGPTLVAAVELVSPGNKDRREFRRAFAAKCASYLHQGIGVVVIDVVTSRQANLHNELVELISAGDEFLLGAPPLYATAYRPLRREDTEHAEVWTETLQVGRPLPVLPLALDRGLCVPIDLEATYTEACNRSRLV